jgi:hypothetical protein
VTTDDRDATRYGASFFFWMLAWVATLALARFGPELLWGDLVVLTWTAIALNIATGVALIVSYLRRLRRLDELQRKIEQDAASIAAGVALVGGFGYFTVAATGLLPTIDAAWVVAGLITAMALSFSVATIVGNVRYR